ncbi:MAG: Acetyl-CoA:oxalate CoA-transferase [Alphaproteobacteria bacterium MarineAlpha10_Bin1]|nr:MAG: Acetyl-CoA:oxalate CoA-transferase [Alphaproteobacteria bacterium MarineAlpha10_Bin1]
MATRLKDVLVVSVEQAVAAPFATARLADAGARVIKIERPEGDFARDYDKHVHGECSWFVWLNRGKQSVVLDFKQADDAAFLHRLISRADIFVQNLAPGAAARAGFASTELRAAHPRLITCDISGYGETGPYRDMKAYDFLVQCEAGIAAVTGTPDEPARVGVSACDIGAGLNAHGAILEALYARGQSGAGDGIAISLFDGMADWMNVPLMHHLHGTGAPKRSGLSHAMIAPYGAYPVGIGGRIVIAIQNEREWARFCADVLGDAALAEDARFRDNARRVANRGEMDDLIAAAFAAHDMESLGAVLQAAGIAYSRLNEVSDLARHPQLRRVSVATASGAVDLVAPPAQFSSDSGALGPVPELGEHTDAVRAEFGDGG